MAEGKTFQAKIELMGKLHASLSGAVKMAQAKLTQLGNVAKKVGAGIGAGFKKLGGLAKSFAGQLIGVTLAMAGLRSAAEFISKAKQEFQANQEAAAALNAILANNPAIVKQGTKELENQQKRFGDLADKMQEASVYSGGMWREAFAGLAQWGAGAADAEKMAGAITDMLAARSGLKATAGEAKALGDQLGKAVKTGKLGTLKKEFGLDKKDEQRFAKMRSSAERIAELNRIVASKYGGRAGALMGTDAGRMRQAENTIADFQSRMGEGFLKIELQWKEAVARMAPALGLVFKTMTENTGKSFDVILTLFEDLELEWEHLSLAFKDPAVIASWEKLKEAADRLFTPIGEAIGGVVTKIGELIGLKLGEQGGFAGFLTQGLDLATAAITGIGTTIDAVINTWEQLSDTAESVWVDLQSFKLPDWIKDFKFPEIKNPFEGWKWPELPGWLRGEGMQAGAIAWPEFTPPEWLTTGFKIPDFKWPEIPQWIKDFKIPDWIKDFKLPEWKWPEMPAWMTDWKWPWEKKSLVQKPEEVPALNEKLRTTQTLVEAVGAAFGGWSVPSTLLSGLDNVVTKANDVKRALSDAAAGAGAAMPAPTHKRGMPMGQHGGIFTRPTIIGEAGAEAAIPLHGGRGPLELLNRAASALGVSRQGTSVNYAPNFTVNGAGPEAAREIERVVRQSHDDLLRQIEALDGEMMRRAFV